MVGRREGRETVSSTPVLVGSRVGLRELAEGGRGGGEDGREERSHDTVLNFLRMRDIVSS